MALLSRSWSPSAKSPTMRSMACTARAITRPVTQQTSHMALGRGLISERAEATERRCQLCHHPAGSQVKPSTLHTSLCQPLPRPSMTLSL